MKKNNKSKGFTLIELLAVIIILGILMLIAIPSVTSYVNNSRKESYVATVKALISGAVNMVNRGDFDAYDPNTTYYIPTECIPVENSKTSPYGDLKDSYVAVTYDESSFNYYYAGTDTAFMGIKLTGRELITIKSIETGIKSIEPNVLVGDTLKIILFDCSGNPEEVEPVDPTAEPELPVPDDYKESDYTMEAITSGDVLTYKKLSPIENSIEKVSYVRRTAPANAIDTWDPGSTKGGKIEAWYLDEDNNGLYELYYGSEYKIYLNSNCRQLYSSMITIKIIDFQNVDTSKVTDMYSMFAGNGSSASGNMQLEHIYGIEKFNTSNVTNMSGIFYSCGNLKELDLSRWDTSKVVYMDRMFSSWNESGITSVDLSSFDLSSVTTMKDMFTWNSNLREITLGKNKSNLLQDARNMFQYSSNITSVDLSKVKIDSSVNTTNMLNGFKNGATIYVDSETTRDYILANRDSMKLKTSFTESNFVIK